MKYCAVVCEYNPFHNGHLYQLETIKKQLCCDRIICVMSGDFVQRAEPAIISKSERTKCALACGADMVIELPVVYATGNGELFAEGAAEIITGLPDVEHMAMGCETGDTEILSTLADIQLCETAEFKELLDSNLKKGFSYAVSYAEATATVAEKIGIDHNLSKSVLSGANNVLCMEYIKALKRKKSSIVPGFIRRDQTNAISSSEIRKRISTEQSIESFVPGYSLEIIKNEISKHPVDFRTYSDIVIHTLRNMSLKNYSNIPEIAEGMEYKILTEVQHTTDLTSLLDKIKSKRYTLSRLKRICLQSVLGITTGVLSDITTVYSRILGIKSDFKHYLSSLPENFYIKPPRDGEVSSETSPLIEIEKRAHKLYSLLTHNNDYYYFERLITI